MVSKPPELKIPTEEKQCNTLEQIQPAAQSSGLKDESQDSIQSILDNLDTLESDDDFEDECHRHSTGMGDLQSLFGTKDDINRLETQQEVIKANQNVIIETQRGISSLLSENVKKRGYH